MGQERTRLLIVDDDPVDREIFKRYLRDCQESSYEFAEVGYGRDAAGRCREFRPDCILLDYNLPDANGLEVVRTLADSDGRPSYPIVMLTGLGNERLAVDAINAGVMDYATKGSATADTLHYLIASAMEKFRLQREITAQQERYKKLLEAIPLMVWSSDPGGGVQFANALWETYAGVRAVAWLDRIHAEDRLGVQHLWLAAIQSGSGFETEARLLRQDGQCRWHLLRAVPLAEPAPGHTWLCTAADIADQKAAQQALLQQQKLDSIGLLAGGIAHDFNNLLVGIMGGTSFALEALSSAHPAHPMLRNVLDASERAAQLTRQMLAYAGKGQFVIEQIDLSNLVACTAELAETLIPDSVELRLDTAVGLPPILSDSGQVQQVVMNLLMNAVESIPDEERGSVAVRTYFDDGSAEGPGLDVWREPIAPGPYIVLEVTDTGVGITEEVRAKMFDPFYTTKFMGRGLGLSAVQGIVRSNRGAIQVSSAVGGGTKFRVFFPAKLQPHCREQAEPEDGAILPKGTVLVIDDEPVVRNVVQKTLGRDGYEVVPAETGRQGLNAIQTRPEITAVLLDMGMPEMNGQAVLEEMLKFRSGLPVIVCSGFNEAEVRNHFAGQALAGVIQKPFTAQQLLSEVNAILGQYSHAAKRQANS